jgi:XTP/dITP diphosphohydrolase
MRQLARLVVATHNAKKAGEMTAILSRRFPNLELRTLADYPGSPVPEETGDTYAQNATIKAVAAANFTGEWCIADDAGLEIDALGGAPGHRSKRFGGEGMSFPAKMARILALMKDVPAERRTARFRCCVVLAAPEAGPDTARTQVFEAACGGRIALEPRGDGGFGYDPIFLLPGLGRTMAELSPDEKHAVSHRGKVLRIVGDWLEGGCASPSATRSEAP